MSSDLSYNSSGWLDDNNETDHITSFSHRFNGVPQIITVLFSPDSGITTYTVNGCLNSNSSTNIWNPLFIELNSKFVSLHIKKITPLFAIFDVQNNSWKKFNKGAWKISVGFNEDLDT